MQTKFRIPLYNPIRFVPENVAIAEQYHNIPFDKAWFSEQLRPWQTKVDYPILMQNNDPLDIYAEGNTDIAATLYVYKCGNPVQVFSMPFTMLTDLPPIIEDGTQYYAQRIKVPKFFDGFDPGIYYMQIEATFVEGLNELVELYISEPIYVKADHRGTLLIDVGNSFNKGNVMFEQLRQRFRHRVPGAFVQMLPKLKQTVFIDQGQNTVPIDATPYRSWKLVIGGDGSPVPDWEIDRMNVAFSCDGIFIDGRQYTPVEGANLAVEEDIPEFPLRVATIELAEVNNIPPYEFVKGGLPLLAPIPAFPFMITGIEFGYTGNPFFIDTTYTRIANLPALEAYIAARNLQVVNQGFTGVIEIESGTGEVVYKLGPDESFTAGQIRVLRYRLGIQQNTTGVATIIPNISMATTTGSAQFVVCNPLNNISAVGWVGTSITPLYIPDYNAPAGGTFTFDIFHDGESITKIYSTGTRFSGINKYGIPGNLPKYLNRLEVTGSSRLTSFDIWNQLKEVRNTLVHLQFTNCSNLTSFPNNLYVPDYTITGPEPGWKLLQYIFLHNNNLNSAAVDNMFISMGNQILEQQWFTYSGSVTLQQLPPAPVGPTSSFTISTLQSYYGFLVGYNT